MAQLIRLISEKGYEPVIQTANSAGYDLRCKGNVEIKPGERVLLSTTVKAVIPQGYYGNIKCRSSSLPKVGLHVCEGVIDADYRGIIKVSVMNLTDEIISIKDKDRVAQIIFQKYYTNVQLMEGTELYERWDTAYPSSRGAEGFGSTGYK